MKSVQVAEVNNKKVFLRVDFNVPIENGRVMDVNRIKSSIPTIQFLLEKKAKVIIGTHIGRPGGKVDPQFSTKPVAEELSKLLGQTVETTDEVVSVDVTAKVNALKPGQVFLLGNLRFDPREEANDEAFAKELASLAEVYVNDAFAVSHRANASVEAITKLLPSFAGLLLQKEVTSLGLLTQSPERPFIIIIGGAKVKDKAGLLKNLADKADKILVGGAVGNTFLAAKCVDMGNSLVDTEMIGECRNMLEKFGSKIILPSDFEKDTKPSGEFAAMDIGPKTREIYVNEIGFGRCIFWNGNLGYTEDKRFTAGTKAIAEAIGKSGVTTVVAGGDTVGFIDTHNLQAGLSFISTGGGAAMEFLAGIKLPGVEALNKASL